MITRIVLGAAVVALVIAALISATAYRVLNGDRVRVALERQASGWLGQPVHIASADARLFPRVSIRLREVRVGEPARLTLETVTLSTGLRALLSRRVEDADVAVSDSRVQMPLPFEIPEIRPVADAGADQGLTVESVRAITLRNVRIVSRGREIDVSADLSLAGSRLTVTSFTATAPATSIHADGVVLLAPTLDAQLRASADRLDLDDLIALTGAFVPADTGSPYSEPGIPGRIVARVTSDTATAGGVSVRQLASTLRLQGNRLSLSPTTFLLFGGHYQGDLDVDMRDAPVMTWTSRVIDLDVAQLAAFGGVRDTISGTLSGTAMFMGRGSDFAAALASGHGDGSVTVVNGAIRKVDLVPTIVRFFGRPAPEAPAATDAFDRIDVRFSLAGQVITADALSLHSSDADIVGQGALALATKVLDGHVDLSLSEALSAQAGSDLHRFTREGNRILLPATIGGTLWAPRMTIDGAAAIGRGLRNDVDRRLQGLLNRLTPLDEQPPP